MSILKNVICLFGEYASLSYTANLKHQTQDVRFIHLFLTYERVTFASSFFTCIKTVSFAAWYRKHLNIIIINTGL